MNWKYVLDDTALPEGKMVPVYPMGVNIILARVDGIAYAVSGKCAHMACPLFTGKLDGFMITCPCHDWRFDIRTGRFLDAPELGIAIYSTKSEEGRVFINLE
jgi:3-phenylpropionate/trans-cinnamate dioxygenase ferredoxin subunit